MINRELLKTILQEKYVLIESTNGQETIDAFKEHEKELSLVLLDMMMPDKTGMQVIEELKEYNPNLDTPIIFVTAMDTNEIETESIKAGAVDYIRKPFNSDVIRARVAAHISLKQNTDFLRREIEKAVKEKTKIMESIVIGLANVVEYRSEESGEHVKRVQEITKLLINKVKETTKLLDDYTEEQLTYIIYASALHDIGKIGVRDKILLKPERLTDEEYDVMKLHTEIGAQMAEKFYLGENEDFVKFCEKICHYHHEKWNGTGYPAGLKGEEIPIYVRIVSVADAFDAIVSPRVYKEGHTIDQALEILEKDKETYFDSKIIDAMMLIKEDLDKLYQF